MGFLRTGCGNEPLKPEDNTELRVTEYGIQRVKVEPKRRTSKEALEMARKSAANNKGVDYGILDNYSRSEEKYKTQDQKNFEALKKGGYIK